jgi:hypothetical protein
MSSSMKQSLPHLVCEEEKKNWEKKKKNKGIRGKWDLVVQHLIGHKMKLNKWVAKVEWDMQDVEVVEGVAYMRSMH